MIKLLKGEKTMKELFMLLLESLKYHGDITSANFYKDGKYASLQFETEKSVYQIGITEEKKKK